jgi:hypothetical protein
LLHERADLNFFVQKSVPVQSGDLSPGSAMIFSLKITLANLFVRYLATGQGGRGQQGKNKESQNDFGCLFHGGLTILPCAFS